MNMKKYAFDRLRGREAQLIDQEKYKGFAVAVAYLRETDELLFQWRADTLKRQPGEISFPGGKIEPGEEPWEAAVRETEEELLFPRERIEIVAPLDVLITPQYYIIYPFLAYLDGYEGTFNTDEVQEVFTVPFGFFLENEPKQYTSEITALPQDIDEVHALLGVESYPWRTATHPLMFYEYRGRVIWGMTARFANNLARLYKGELK